MSKPTEKQESLEIIELATSGLDELAKAFDLIAEVCNHIEHPEPILSEEEELPVIH
ncbi:hypothetical protein MRY87_08865 [bacterium]|nr:hypothetical protein [bacterium]